MFLCQLCNTQSKPNEKLVKVTLETRERHYNNTDFVGSEIVKEVNAHRACAILRIGESTAVGAALVKAQEKEARRLARKLEAFPELLEVPGVGEGFISGLVREVGAPS